MREKIREIYPLTQAQAWLLVLALGYRLYVHGRNYHVDVFRV